MPNVIDTVPQNQTRFVPTALPPRKSDSKREHAVDFGRARVGSSDDDDDGEDKTTTTKMVIWVKASHAQQAQ